MGILEDVFQQRDPALHESGIYLPAPVVQDLIAKKPGSDSPEISSARLTARGGMVGALIAAVALLVGAAYTGEHDEQMQTGSIQASQEELEYQRKVEQDEELESLNCGDVFEREHRRATENPEFVLWALAVNDEILLSAEERDACPTYGQLLSELQKVAESQP